MSVRRIAPVSTETDPFLEPSQPGVSKPRVLVFLSLTAGLALAAGILIGIYGIQGMEEHVAGIPGHLLDEADPDISKLIIDAIDPARIEANLKFLSQKPHIAGRQRDFDLVKMLQTTFTENGLHVQTTPYDVLLSYPDEKVPNSVRLLDVDSTVVYDAKDDQSNFSQLEGVVPPFNAYSPSRLVEGSLVFAGYGRVEDYAWLAENNVTVSGSVVIVKYGRLFRADKVNLAYLNGATGLIFYSDPADCTGQSMGDFRVYPDTLWMPPDGAQRGTIYRLDGDPLTPGYPANNLGYRFTEEDSNLPKIPCHTIGYAAAFNILKHLGGLPIPADSDMGGGLNLTYRTGPEFLRPEKTIQLNVTTRNERALVENVFGFIKGAAEPDRYVLFGNHRDAWVYGALDPSSGTAVMMELARVMGDLVKRGVWRPRRTIVFCSWGAEEYGLIGSTEWVEQYVSTLRERAIAYINVDYALKGNHTLSVNASPLMYNIIHEASKKVKNPNPSEIEAGRPTVYDTWLHVSPWNFTQGSSTVVPLIQNLGGFTDYTALYQRAGVASADVKYWYDSKLHPGFPLYHTEYETFDLVKNHYDRNFEFHTAVARVSAEAVRVLADSLILPFNISNYAVGLQACRQTLDREYGAALRQNIGPGTYDKLQEVIDDFGKDVANFEAKVNEVNRRNPFSLREINDKIMLLEKAFLYPDGLPVRPLKKHVIFAENLNHAYGGNSFPGLVDLMFEIDKEPARWERVKQHFHTILSIIQTAGFTLRDVTNFMSETL